LLDTDQKIIFVGPSKSFCWNLKNNEQYCKKFWYSSNWFEYIIILIVQQNYFLICIQLKF